MTKLDQRQDWRARVGWLAGQLLVIFLGVTAAFVVENYRESLSQRQELQQAIAGTISELEHFETGSAQHADAFDAAIGAWAAADREARRAVPAHYRIPGAPRPPAAAWNATVSSGITRLIEPKLRLDLGYFYNEFIGMHEKYDRYAQFTEREILPRVVDGPDAFYGSDGKIMPIFRVHMDLQSESAGDLRRFGKVAGDLRSRLERLRDGKNL
jgi:hypothetical protein